MTVSKKGEGFLECRVDVGGKISNRKVRIHFLFQPLSRNLVVPISHCVHVSFHNRVSTLPTPSSRSVP
jgi:hypothetical protein